MKDMIQRTLAEDVVEDSRSYLVMRLRRRAVIVKMLEH